jgi:hypothetical protein
LAALKKPVEHSSGSYESDDFEDVSASGSGSKSKLNYWPSSKGSSSAPSKPDYDPSAMEEYIKKQ